jgi:two-component system response regulator HydG
MKMTQNLHILIVDDDQSMAHTLNDILSLAGHTVVETYSGPEALEKARAQFFDCVLADIRMPEMDGVELHHQLRQAQPGLPVVLMTAYAAEELIRQGLNEGIVGVFDKPLDINHLLGFFTSLAKDRVITIVDDDAAFCETLGSILEHRGFSVAQITDPQTDVESMGLNAQVLLLDMKLDHLDVLDVLKEIRRRYPALPVLLMTGYRQEMAVAIRAALAIDAYTCLYKPLEIQELLLTLAQLQLVRLRAALRR